VGTLAFYERPTFVEVGWFWLGVGISASALAALFFTTASSVSGRAQRLSLVVAFVVMHAGTLLPHSDWPIAAALAFIGLWWCVAVAAHRGALRPVLHLATAAIGLRLLVVYFEVFGSLLDTGIALFISEPMKLYYSGPFWVKMYSLVLALIFTYTLWRKVASADETRIAPYWRPLAAIVSLVLWFGVGAGGRWIGFSG